MSRAAFVATFGPVFEDTPWIAAATYDAGLDARHDTAAGLHAAMVAVLRAANDDAKLALIRAHPDLAGRLALAGALGTDSTAEQKSAGLDQCTPDELERFTSLNQAYQARFGFPFIMAVKGRARTEVLAAFERRLAHDRDTEFTQALAQIERIAWLRLHDLLPET